MYKYALFNLWISKFDFCLISMKAFIIEIFLSTEIGFSEKIKQSDVVLLGFPLQMNMSKSTRRNDLEIYENVSEN